jgi:hypothetical protein
VRCPTVGGRLFVFRNRFGSTLGHGGPTALSLKTESAGASHTFFIAAPGNHNSKADSLGNPCRQERVR